MNQSKSIIDTYFTKNQPYLIECAYNILKKINRTDLVNDLVNQSYEYIYNNLQKLEDHITKSGMTEAIIINYMNKQIVWERTEFKKKFLTKHNTNQIQDSIIDEIDIQQLLNVESEIKNKLTHIKQTIPTLPLDQQILFSLMFSGDTPTSVSKVSNHIGLCKTQTYHLMRNLKDTIISEYTNGFS